MIDAINALDFRRFYVSLAFQLNHFFSAFHPKEHHRIYQYRSKQKIEDRFIAT